MLCPLCPLRPSDLASLCRSCLPHLMASVFLNNCVLDMCNFQGLQQMLCAHMAALTETCQDAGYRVKPWREPQFCRELPSGAGLGGCFFQMHMRAEDQHLRELAQAWGCLMEPFPFHTWAGKSAESEISTEKITVSCKLSKSSQLPEAIRTRPVPARAA